MQKHSPFYKNQLEGVNISNENALEVYRGLEFLTKDIINQNESAFLSVPENEVAEIVTTSGTTGTPLAVKLTFSDIERLAINEKFSFELIGCTSDDVIQITTTLDKLFMAGVAYYNGALALGATVLRVGPGNTKFQWDNIFRHGVTTLVGVPSFIKHLMDYAEQNDIDFKKSPVKKVLCIGEPTRNPDMSFNALSQYIKDQWDLELYSTYASTEMATAFTECTAMNGVHMNSSLIFAEVVGEDGLPVENGAEGEVVVTPLGVEGMPFVKFKTGDICSVYYDKCSCGLDTLRLGPIIGRRNQLLKVKGTSIFPSSITGELDQLLLNHEYVVKAEMDEFGNDKVVVVLPKDFENDKTTIKKLINVLKASIRLTPELEFLSTKQIIQLKSNSNFRKKLKFLDNRV